jgi:glycerate 2-kinase
MSKYSISTQTLRSISDSEKIVRVLDAALQAADPFEAVQQALNYENEVVHINGQPYNLARYGRVFVVAFGKAALAMTQALAAALDGRLNGGIVVLKHLDRKSTRLNSSHP